jgi:hypothetical protein
MSKRTVAAAELLRLNEQRPQGYKPDPEPMAGLVNVGYNFEDKKLWQVLRTIEKEISENLTFLFFSKDIHS